MTGDIPKIKFVQAEISRHGKVMYYFRRGKGARLRLPDYDDARFWDAYAIAKDSSASTYKPNFVRQEFQIRQKQKTGSTIARAVKSAKQRSAARGLPFDIDYDWAVATIESQKFCCCLTGIPFYMANEAKSTRNPYTPSLDRIDPAGGYTKDNVRIVIYAVNIMLMDWGTKIFERVANGYRYTKGTKSRILFPPVSQGAGFGAK
jgi:hypothetical protein